MTLERDVEKLRAKVAALEAGEAAPDDVPQEPAKPSGIVAYWCDAYLRAHGFNYVVQPKDAGNLVRLAKLYVPAEKMAWMVNRYFESDDEFTIEHGYSVSIFAVKAQGLAFKWVKSVQEPALRREKAELERRLRDLESNPQVQSAVDRLLKAVK